MGLIRMIYVRLCAEGEADEPPTHGGGLEFHPKSVAEVPVPVGTLPRRFGSPLAICNIATT
jgi:hypothetical protein